MFRPLATDLSPEWLTCDGMLGPQQVAARRAEIMERWAAVEEKIGKHVTPQEVEEMLIRLLP
jgi:hypothetical protein